jgi:AcrR family transcriptional regulator
MRERQREAASGAILEAAEEVAAERGIENTSIAAIAARAGVAAGTLYNYFPDREALIASWFQWRRDQMVPKIEAAAKAHAHLPFERWLRAYLGDLMEVFEEKRAFIRVMAAIDQKTIKIDHKKPQVLIAMTDAVEERLAPNPKAKEYARMLIGMIRGIAHWRCETGDPMDGDAELIATTFLQGFKR